MQPLLLPLLAPGLQVQPLSSVGISDKKARQSRRLGVVGVAWWKQASVREPVSWARQHC